MVAHPTTPFLYRRYFRQQVACIFQRSNPDRPRVEWRIGALSRKLRHTPKGVPLFSPTFAVTVRPFGEHVTQKFSGLRLQLFPAGSYQLMRLGYCSLFLEAPLGEIGWAKYNLQVGREERGPFDCLNSGMDDFCAIQQEILKY